MTNLLLPKNRQSLTLLLLTGLTFLTLFSGHSLAQSVKQSYSLEIMPTKCFVVEQGKDCYFDIEVIWRASEIDDYCLISSLNSTPLKCWTGLDHGKLERELITKGNVIFKLQKKNTGKLLVSKEMKVVWVYKKNIRAHTSWRMF